MTPKEVATLYVLNSTTVTESNNEREILNIDDSYCNR